MSRGGKLVGAAAFPEKGTAKHHDAQREGDKDDKINQMHSLPFLMGSASRA